MRKFFCLFSIVVALVPAARADYAVLRSGQRLHITGYERQGSSLRLYVAGGTLEVAAGNVIRIEPEDFFPASPPAPSPPQAYAQAIRAAAQKHGLDEALISSVIAVESNFNPRAVSPKQARGLMQLLPATAARYSVTNVFDPAQNIEGGTHYLKDLLELYHGDLALALASYNAGPDRVERYGGIPPYAETRTYVHRVTKTLAMTRKNVSGGAANRQAMAHIPRRARSR